MHMQMTRAVFVAETLALILAAPLCVPAQEKPHVTSEQVTHAIQQLEKLAQRQIQENALPGLAIAVVFQDKVVYAKGFGVRDASTKLPVDAGTVFQLASLSKPIGSAVSRYSRAIRSGGRTRSRARVGRTNGGIGILRRIPVTWNASLFWAKNVIAKFPIDRSSSASTDLSTWTWPRTSWERMPCDGSSRRAFGEG